MIPDLKEICCSAVGTLVTDGGEVSGRGASAFAAKSDGAGPEQIPK